MHRFTIGKNGAQVGQKIGGTRLVVDVGIEDTIHRVEDAHK